jgi:predicted XRE-type DNA-binding protein
LGAFASLAVEASRRRPINDLLRGRIDRFSLDALVVIALRAGLSVSVKATQRAA